jgi:hypothetical protein
MTGMSFGYRESLDSRLRGYLVVAQYEKNKQFGKNVVHLKMEQMVFFPFC